MVHEARRGVWNEWKEIHKTGNGAAKRRYELNFDMKPGAYSLQRKTPDPFINIK